MLHFPCNYYFMMTEVVSVKQGKKFAKPELKSCIEEFEDKLQKFHMERKEQEETARNAHIHQQKIGSREGFAAATDTEDHAESNTNAG